jgi:hypothetical protein
LNLKRVGRIFIFKFFGFYIFFFDEKKKGDFIRLLRLSTKYESEKAIFELKTEGAKEGMTHVLYPNLFGNYKAQYVKGDGKLIGESEILLIGPIVKLESKLSDNRLKVKWEIRLGTGLPDGWDWIGLFQKEEDDPKKYWDYKYLNLKSNHLYFDPPKKPGEWKFLFFSKNTKYFPFGTSNSIKIEGLI